MPKECRFTALTAEATALAGEPDDLMRRAAHYRELYRHSHGNFVFALLAAHGAVWAVTHFKRGRSAARLVASLLPRAERAQKMETFETLELAFKELSQQVFIETYRAYWLTAEESVDAERLPVGLQLALAACHDARKARRRMDHEERRALYLTFFQMEQEAVVDDCVTKAFNAFDWPLLRYLAVRPIVDFRYFGSFKWLRFQDFNDMKERVRHGVKAYAIAEQMGLENVEAALDEAEGAKRNLIGCPLRALRGLCHLVSDCMSPTTEQRGSLFD